jgi:hypothetical protein
MYRNIFPKPEGYSKSCKKFMIRRPVFERSGAYATDKQTKIIIIVNGFVSS